MGHNSPCLKCGLHILISFQRVLYGKVGKNRNFVVEKPDKYFLSHVIKENIDSDVMHSWYHTMRMDLYFCDIAPKNLNPQPNHEKTILQIPGEMHSKIFKYTSPVPPKIVKIIKKRKVQESIIAKRSLFKMITKYNVESWLCS